MNRRGKVALGTLGVFGVAVTLAVIGLVAFLITRQSQQPANDEEVIRLTFEKDMKSRRSEIPPERPYEEEEYSYSLEQIQIEGEWAIATILTKDESEKLMGGPALGIFRNIKGKWQYATLEIYREWLWQLPESLVPYESKIFHQ